MESPPGTLRDNGIDITTTVVLPPLTASNLGGNPEIVSYVEKNLRAPPCRSIDSVRCWPPSDKYWGSRGLS